MKRIALYYENVLDVGGVERYLLSILKYANREHYHFVLTARGSPRFESNLSGFPIQRAELIYRHPLHPGNIIDLWKILRSEKIDLLHVHSPSAAIAGRLAAALRGIPVVYSIHLPARWYHGTRNTLRARIGRALYKAIDCLLNFTFTSSLIYPSSIVMQMELQEKCAPKTRSVYIPNGVDLPSLEHLPDRESNRTAFNLLSDQVVILFVGRLDEQKGLDVLMAAMQKIPPLSAPWVLWIVGDGPLEKDLRSWVDQAGLDKSVRFFGYQSDIRPYLSASDIFVLPSRYDTMPLAMLEALAAGLPCVVSAVGDMAEVIQTEVNGLVVKPEDPVMLSSAIHRLLVDTELRRRLGIAARLRAEDFDAREMTAKVQEIYARLLSSSTS